MSHVRLLLSVSCLLLSLSSASAFTPSLRLPSTHPRPLALRPSPSRQAGGRAAPAGLLMQLGGGDRGGTSVLERKTVTTAPAVEDKVDPDKPYHVLLFNDPMNTREFVCEVLVSVFGHSKSQAYTIMQNAHSTGFAVCNTTDKEEADSQSAELGNNNLMSSVVQAE
eukprot:CAMPEP_0173439248 /NCGR_PEP_ID=MMETSP1357-20121228/20851_1 /TAXON_ID=77926 /ORGANISM="Hemiselmis rufescens, Strain PCC563" /LENGTH=165 /DNA_ID=CAMNT_0014404601 /DNA_START=37 /DNA_END=534 /DNA_ORIENTATION=+